MRCLRWPGSPGQRWVLDHLVPPFMAGRGPPVPRVTHRMQGGPVPWRRWQRQQLWPWRRPSPRCRERQLPPGPGEPVRCPAKTESSTETGNDTAEMIIRALLHDYMYISQCNDDSTAQHKNGAPIHRQSGMESARIGGRKAIEIRCWLVSLPTDFSGRDSLINPSRTRCRSTQSQLSEPC